MFSKILFYDADYLYEVGCLLYIRVKWHKTWLVYLANKEANFKSIFFNNRNNKNQAKLRIFSAYISAIKINCGHLKKKEYNVVGFYDYFYI